MPSFRARVFLLASHAVGRGASSSKVPSHHVLRRTVERTMTSLPVARGTRVSHRRVGAIDVEVVRPPRTRTDRALFYIHGGGYVAGSPRTHRAFTSRLARDLECEVWVPDYRLAPEHPFPAGLEDCTLAWSEFATVHRGRTLLLGGESAGGGLGLALAYLARERGLAAPDRLYLQSAWLDLRMAGTSYVANDRGDIMTSSRLTEVGFARRYAGEHPRDDPRMSPVLGDPAGLPPTYVQVSAAEIFYSDSEAFIERAKASGVDVTTEVADGLWHAWPLMAPLFPESNRSIERLRRWFDEPI